MLFRRKKKDESHKGDIFLAKGIYLKRPMMDNGNRLLNCFLRCMVVFLLTFGSIGGFLSAFSLSYNYILVIVMYLVLALFFSWLYSLPNFFWRDLGYIAFFAGFVFAIFQLRLYANSGFYAVVNRVLERAQTFFDLSGTRQYEVTIDNSYFTVAVVAIFLGMVFIIVLNIWLSSRVSVFWTCVITFPILLIPFYMKLNPDPIYVVSLAAGYLLVMVFKGNGHFIAYAKDSTFLVKGFRKNRVLYTQDGKVFRQILTAVFVISFAVVILCASVFPQNIFMGKFKRDWLRETTSETVGNFVLLGFSSFYNRYSSTGGMSGGKLGGVSNVTPDYQADLKVTFAPYTNEAVYLKAYTGGYYGDNQWEDIYKKSDGLTDSETQKIESQDGLALFEEESLKREAMALRERFLDGEEYAGYGQMEIENVGADISYLYYPYYTVLENYSRFSNYGMLRTVNGLGMSATAFYSYYPKVEWESSLGEVCPKDMDTSKVDEMYKDVPDKNKEVIKNEIKAIGLNDGMTENEIVEAVRSYFADNIPYTLKPGATPRKEDFINYFLTSNRKGYCAHFASAATLIFREMGIPARYVEGYAFGLEAVLASDEDQLKKYEDYYQGYSRIGESAVITVEVTDAMAHAWVEVYVDGFGWKVVEVTPGSNETVDEDNFWDAFASFLRDAGISEDGVGEAIFGELNISQYAWLIQIIVAILVLVMMVTIGRILVRKGVRFYHCHVGERDMVVIAYYADLCDMVRLCDTSFNTCKSHREQLQYINGHFGMDLNVDELTNQLEQISYSQQSLADEELLRMLALLKQVRKNIWKTADMKKRLRLCRR